MVLLLSLRNNFYLRLMHTRKSIEFLFVEKIKLFLNEFLSKFTQRETDETAFVPKYIETIFNDISLWVNTINTFHTHVMLWQFDSERFCMRI